MLHIDTRIAKAFHDERLFEGLQSQHQKTKQVFASFFSAFFEVTGNSSIFLSVYLLTSAQKLYVTRDKLSVLDYITSVPLCLPCGTLIGENDLNSGLN